jgi:DNA polymerase III subunit beta
MKVIISKVDLVILIGKVQSIVPGNKPTIPILANVLIEAIDDELILSATDLIVSVRCFCEAKVLEEGAITLPARRFFQLARELTSPQVEIHSISPEIAFINAGTSHFKIQGMHKNEFPTLPDLSDGISFSLQTSIFKEMLARTAFAAGRDDQRQILNGILMQCQQNKATFIGTNGKCVAKLETPLDSSFSGSYVLPIKAVEEMIKILDEKEERTKITLMHDKVAIETGSVILITKLLSGQYPDILRIIPQKTANAVSLHREELISLLRQVSLFTSDTSTSVRFSFSPGTLHLSAMSGEIGEGQVHMPVNYEGNKLDIAFNPHYFLDILRHSKDETVTFAISDSYNPGLVSDSSQALFVIMPMRLESAYAGEVSR